MNFYVKWLVLPATLFFLTLFWVAGAGYPKDMIAAPFPFLIWLVLGIFASFIRWIGRLFRGEQPQQPPSQWPR